MTEQPFRDNGPVGDYEQALAQFRAQTHGLPEAIKRSYGVSSVLVEALFMAGITATEYERRQLEQLNPEQAVIVAGMLVRARLTPAPGKGGAAN